MVAHVTGSYGMMSEQVSNGDLQKSCDKYVRGSMAMVKLEKESIWELASEVRVFIVADT